MSNNILLMCADTTVMVVNYDVPVFDVLRPDLLPYTLRGKIRYSLPDKPENLKTNISIGYSNKDAFLSWLACRALSLSRKNAKWLYNLLSVEQVSTDRERAKISIMCKAVSVLDNYWIKRESDNIQWEDINVRKNSLNDIIAQVALHGKSLSLCGSLISPEFTTNGAYAKAWRRKDDRLWLHKTGSIDSSESRVEVKCSSLLDKMNVSHCHYEAAEDDDVYVSACPVMTNECISILSAMDFQSYCNVNGLNSEAEILKLDPDNYYKMFIVDYLIANRDRHGQNWGLYYNPDNMKLIGLHPLFDHNNAFDKDWLEDRNATYQITGKSIRDSAHYAMKRTKFHFTEPICRTDFMSDKHYKEFMWRAKDLGVEVYPETYDERVYRIFRLYGIPYSKRDLLPSCELDNAALNSAALNLL